MQHLARQQDAQCRSANKFDQKWALLKPLLEPLFYSRKLSDIIEIMAREHGHVAKCVILYYCTYLIC